MTGVEQNPNSWDDFPRERALAWCRTFFDYPPHFPGAGLMNFGYHAFKQGRPPGFHGWAEAARRGESVGFTPDLYYTLRLTLSVIGPEGYPRHPQNHAYRENGAAWEQVPIDLREWALWVELVRSGTTPLHATRSVLSGGEDGPRGFLIDVRAGTIVTTDDAGAE